MFSKYEINTAPRTYLLVLGYRRPGSFDTTGKQQYKWKPMSIYYWAIVIWATCSLSNVGYLQVSTSVLGHF